MRDFMAWVKDIHEDIVYQRQINNSALGRFFVRGWKLFNWAVMVITIIANIFMVVEWKEQVHRLDPSKEFWIYHHAWFDIPWRITGALHNLASFCLVLSYFLSNIAGFASSKRSYERKLQQLNKLVLIATVDPNSRKSKLEINLMGTQTLYYVAFLVFSLCGTIISPAFFAFHLLQIVENNELLTRVIRAVTKNGRSLLWVAFLGVIIVYIYGLAAFLTLRDILHANDMFCETLWRCTLTMIREGFIYRIMRMDYPVRINDYHPNDDFHIYGVKLIFDISFFIIVITIGLNVIFGIIVDTFRQLRDDKWRIEQDMETRCFICGRNSYEFEQKGISFQYHTNVEHNMLAYVFFFVQLHETAPEDYSHLEMYLYKMVHKENYNFFPINRALSLDGSVASEAAVERDLLMMRQLNFITNKLNEEQITRLNDQRKKQQMEWEQLYKKVSKTPIRVHSGPSDSSGLRSGEASLGNIELINEYERHRHHEHKERKKSRRKSSPGRRKLEFKPPPKFMRDRE